MDCTVDKMTMELGDYDADRRQVPVTFVHEDFPDEAHSRFVNACHDAEGGYDEEATIIRCDEVALGVKMKIEAGVFRPAPAPAPAPEEGES